MQVLSTEERSSFMVKFCDHTLHHIPPWHPAYIYIYIWFLLLFYCEYAACISLRNSRESWKIESLFLPLIVDCPLYLANYLTWEFMYAHTNIILYSLIKYRTSFFFFSWFFVSFKISFWSNVGIDHGLHSDHMVGNRIFLLNSCHTSSGRCPSC